MGTLESTLKFCYLGYLRGRLITKHGRTDVLILSFEIKCNWFKKIMVLLFEFYAFLMKSARILLQSDKVLPFILISQWINTLLINKVLYWQLVSAFEYGRVLFRLC